MSVPTQAQTNHRIGRVLHLWHSFEEQRKAFGVMLRCGTPPEQMLWNAQYVEWLKRNRDKIKELRRRLDEKMEYNQ